MLAHCWAKLFAAVAPAAPASWVSVIETRNMARTALGSLRGMMLPLLLPGSLIPIRCSLHMAVFDVPSVTDAVLTPPWLFELLYQGFLSATITPDHVLIVPGPPTFAA